MNKRILSITSAIFLEILLHILMGNADTLMISHYSDQAVAAVGVANQFVFFVIVILGFVAQGAAVVIAQWVGAKEQKKARETAVTAIVLNLIFGLFISFLFVLLSSTFLHWMGLSDNLIKLGNTYLQLVGCFMFIEAVMMASSSILRSHGFAKETMLVTLGMNGIHVIGNYLFLFGPFGIPVFGVAGVAWSTIISRALGLLFMMWLVRKKIGKLPWSHLLRFPKGEIGALLRSGVPMASEQLSYNGSQLVITSLIAILGTEAISARIYTQNLMMFIMVFGIAIGQGTQIVVGHLVGANQKDEAYDTCLRSLKWAMPIAFGISALFALWRYPMLHVFTNNQYILEMAAPLLLLTMILEPGRTFNLVIIGSLQAAGDLRFPVYMAVFSMWGLGVGLAYYLGVALHWGLIGIWIAFIADEWFRGICMLFRWKSRIWIGLSLIRPSSKAGTLNH